MQTVWLLGGLGLGAGLMYLLDPEKGAERRDMVRGHVVDYGRQTSDLLDDTRRTLGRQAQAVLPRTRVPFRRQPGLGKRLLTQAEEMGLPYLLEPQGGPQRRARLLEKGRAYWHTTGTLLSSTVQNGAHLSDSRQR